MAVGRYLCQWILVNCYSEETFAYYRESPVCIRTATSMRLWCSTVDKEVPISLRHFRWSRRGGSSLTKTKERS